MAHSHVLLVYILNDGGPSNVAGPWENFPPFPPSRRACTLLWLIERCRW